MLLAISKDGSMNFIHEDVFFFSHVMIAQHIVRVTVYGANNFFLPQILQQPKSLKFNCEISVLTF